MGGRRRGQSGGTRPSTPARGPLGARPPLHRPGAGGIDHDAAARCLATALAEAPPDAPAEVSWITGAQQWAVQVALANCLELHPHGPVMVRGEPGPLHPYLPDGAFG